MKKDDFIEKMLKKPLGFNEQDFQNFLQCYLLPTGYYNTKEAFQDMRHCIQRIYDLNEQQLLETSNANSGLLGKFNRKITHIRQKLYFRRVSNQKESKNYVRIYAEGDSWFLFPVFVRDIVDWLKKRKDFLIYSDAFGGDWITNIIYEGQYIESLSTYSPDIFLISGGGNDMVGNNRLAVMVSGKGDQPPKYSKENPLTDSKLSQEERDYIMLAQPYITKDFYAFVYTMKVQYSLLFKNLYANKSKHKHLISITHGYAYPYPKKGSNFSWRYPLQPIVNKLMNSGQWLFRPLMIKGVLNEEIQRAIITAFIYEFNQMMMSIAMNPEFPNVYHIDCRHIPARQKDWYDELHLKSHVYKRVAGLYETVIDKRNEKIPKVIDSDFLL